MFSSVARFALTLLCGGSIILAIFLLSLPQSPQVIVNMPADAKPLAELEKNPSISISEERAVLWWTVYKYTLEKTGFSSTSYIAANQAVEKAYGPTPPLKRN